MDSSSTFWDNVESPDDNNSESKNEEESTYLAREPQEISKKIITLSTLLMFSIPLLLLSAPFALVGMGVLGQDECWGDLEYLEDGKLHCVEGEKSPNPTYSFSETHVIVTHSQGYSDVLRWEIIGDGGVIGYAYYDAYYDEEEPWFSHGYCEWEGGENVGSEQWYCGVNEESVSRFGFENWYYYCEYQEMNWYCTDSFGQSASFADTSDETRADANVLNKWVYNCLPVVTKSPFENTSMIEITEIEAKVVLPQWCFETPIFSDNESVEHILPFNGEAVYLYPNGIGYGSIDLLHYSNDSLRYQMISLHDYNEDGTLTEESEESMQLFGSFFPVVIVIIYLSGGYLLYALSTGRTYIEHLGTENTLIVSTSWRNKPRKVKATISLTSSSLLRHYTTSSTHTDSDGHSYNSTSHHHEITHFDRQSDELPSGFNTEELLKLTGLKLAQC